MSTKTYILVKKWEIIYILIPTFLPLFTWWHFHHITYVMSNILDIKQYNRPLHSQVTNKLESKYWNYANNQYSQYIIGEHGGIHNIDLLM